MQASAPVLRKGGGAISGIGETFSANPATGTFAFSIPLPVSPARALTPDLALSYDSGAGGSPFGLGWSCAPPSISRSTEKGLPTYVDERDVFVLSGMDDLVAELDGAGQPVRLTVSEDGEDWSVRRFRPRIEGGFARIEYWRNRDRADSHWRVWSASNTVSVFGRTADARIADPDAPDRVYQWKLSRVFDAHGNLAVYRYRRDDDAGTVSAASEWQRKGRPHGQLYLVEILYGNRTPFVGPEPEDADFCFALRFAHGAADGDAWACRDDAFSSYRPGFELRTRRLCSQITCHHNFPDRGLVFEPVKALVLGHETPPHGQARLTRVFLRAWSRDGSGSLTAEDMPPLLLAYSDPEPVSGNTGRIRMAGRQDPFLPVTDAQWAFEDLFGEAMPGIVQRSGGAISFSRNMGGAIGPREGLAAVPAAAAEGLPYTQSPAGNAMRAHVIEADGLRGRHDTDAGGAAGYFHASRAVPHGVADDRTMRIVDLDGDGIGDILKSDGEGFFCFASRGALGHRDAAVIRLPISERSSPRFVFSLADKSIHLADMTGDGLADIVRMTATSVTYWPNLGHGRFGPAVAMAGVGAIDHPDRFDASRLRLVDLDGNGLSDLVYLRDGRIDIRVNDNGNAMAPPVVVDAPYRPGAPPASAQFIDVAGNGMPCLVWADEAGSGGETPLLYWHIRGVLKPHLLTRIESPLGALTELRYKPSTAYYLADLEAGTPWATRLHFPVHCLAETRVSDRVTGYTAATRYEYHHGCHDNDDRAFRGFGRVDTVETEEQDHGETDPVAHLLHQPPILTRTWYHTGASALLRDLSAAYEAEYFRHPALAIPSLQPLLPAGLETEEFRQAIRAAKGTPLRSEVYSLDGSVRQDIPYSVTAHRVRVVKRQNGRRDPGADNDRGRWAVFQTLERDTVTVTLDRNPDDARISESVVLAHDDFGNPLLAASISHARASVPEDVPDFAAEAQRITRAVVSETGYTAPREDGPAGIPNVLCRTRHARYLPAACETRSWELRGLRGRIPGINDDLAERFANAPDLAFLSDAPDGKRLLAAGRVRYFDDTLSSALPLGRIGKTGHLYRSETLAFTTAHLVAIYGGRLGSDPVARARAMRAAWYAHSEDRDGVADPDLWWVFSSVAGFAADPADNFHLPVASTDPAGRTSHVTRDADNLLSVEATNKAGQTVRAVNDYRLLAPCLVRDINGNWSAARHDAFGRPVAVATMGKVAATGDPTGYEAAEGDNLAFPSQEYAYDFRAFVETGRPTQARAVAFERHHFQGGDRSLTQETRQHTGGLGQIVMSKVQAHPGMALAEQADGRVLPVDTEGQLRWIGTGRTVFNNKGQPLKRYEPYFSVTPDYETDPRLVEQGPSATMLYDAAGRSLARLHADKSWSKSVATPWKSVTHDAGDTCLVERLSDDPDIGSRFGTALDLLQDGNWLDDRRADAGDAAAKRAADQSEAYAGTPAVAHADTLGRPVVVVADLGAGHGIETRSVLDIEGNTRAIIDSAGRKVEQSLHSMLPPPDSDTPRPALWTRLMDAGERVILVDALGRKVQSWDSRGHVARMTHDALDRPVASHVTMPDGREVCTSRIDYGDDLPDAQARNMMGQVWRNWDQSGLAETLAVDFKGNVTRSARRFARSWDSDIDWPDAVPERLALLEPETFVSTAEFDALNRITRATAPSAALSPDPGLPVDETALTVSEPRYDRGGRLAAMLVTLRGSAPVNHLLGLTYDARGQRQSVTCGNGVTTRYEYDPKTGRLTRLVCAKADGTVLQDCRYSYDIVGNIVAIHDAAVATAFFANQQVDALSTYVHDPLYRLRRATGREHIGRSGAPDAATGTLFDTATPGLHSLRNYEQIHDFDDHGNLTRIRHLAAGGGWTRHYRHGADDNRLRKSWIGSESDEPASDDFTHDAHGSMIAMPETAALGWDFADRLHSVDKGNGPETWYVHDGTGGRVRKVRHHTGTHIRSERLYFGSFEIYREFGGADGALKLERESLHVSDDAGRIALVETLTVDAGSRVTALRPLVRYQLGNHLGSVALELDETGAEISREEYHPYGTSAFYSGVDGARAPPKRYRYTGKERDAETGFTYHGARHYAPWLGRWTSADPIGTGDGLNLYAYVAGRPVMAIDSTGEFRQLPLILGGLLIPSTAHAPTSPEDPATFRDNSVRTRKDITVTQTENGIHFDIRANLVLVLTEKDKSEAIDRLVAKSNMSRKDGFSIADQNRIQQQVGAQDIADQIEKSLERAFSGSDTHDGQSYSWAADVNIRVADSRNDLADDEIEIFVAQIQGTTAGQAPIGGRGIAIEPSFVSDVVKVAADRFEVRLDHKITHEFGHVLGLHHPWTAVAQVFLFQDVTAFGEGDIMSYFSCGNSTDSIACRQEKSLWSASVEQILEIDNYNKRSEFGKTMRSVRNAFWEYSDF